MPRPYRSCLNRLALAGWVLYAVGILLLPLWDEAHERNRAFDRDLASFQVCQAAAAERGIPASQAECDSVYRARVNRDAEAYQFGSEYRALGWRFTWIIPIVLICPPFILYVVLYSLVFVVAKAVTCFGELDGSTPEAVLPSISITQASDAVM